MGTEVTPTKCRVVVEPVFQMRSGALRRWKDVNAPVQNLLFRFKLRVTNVDSTPFPGCTLSDIEVADTSNLVVTTFDTKLSIPMLNPKESHDLLVDDYVALKQEGACWFTYTVEPPEGFQAMVCQSDSHEGSANEGRNVVVVQRSMELQQRLTNQLLITIAALTLVEGVVGLQNIALSVLRAVQAVFRWIGNIGG